MGSETLRKEAVKNRQISKEHILTGLAYLSTLMPGKEEEAQRAKWVSEYKSMCFHDRPTKKNLQVGFYSQQKGCERLHFSAGTQSPENPIYTMQLNWLLLVRQVSKKRFPDAELLPYITNFIQILYKLSVEMTINDPMDVRLLDYCSILVHYFHMLDAPNGSNAFKLAMDVIDSKTSPMEGNVLTRKPLSARTASIITR